jgi:hypothetical protein
MLVIMATMMTRTISWRKSSGPQRRRCKARELKGVAEDRVYLEGGQVDDQEWQVISIKLVLFKEDEDVVEEMGEQDKGNQQ